MKKALLSKCKENRTQMIILLVIGFLCWGSYALAKYFSQQTQDSTAKAVEMFFTSDLLKESVSDAKEYDYLIAEWEAGDTISIELRNFPDSERLTNRNITYTVEVNDPTATFKDANEGISSTAGVTEALTLAKDSQEAAMIEIKLGDDFLDGVASGAGKVATVKAKASYPYTKELTARFMIEKAASGFKVVVEDAVDSPYAKVIVTTEEEKQLQLVWNSDAVVPDQTNPIIDNKTIISDNNNKVIDLGTLEDTGSFTFYMMKYDESKDYTTNHAGIFDVIEKQGGG